MTPFNKMEYGDIFIMQVNIPATIEQGFISKHEEDYESVMLKTGDDYCTDLKRWDDIDIEDLSEEFEVIGHLNEFGEVEPK